MIAWREAAKPPSVSHHGAALDATPGWRESAPLGPEPPVAFALCQLPQRDLRRLPTSEC